MGKKKGKGKPSADVSGDQPGSSGAEPQQPQPAPPPAAPGDGQPQQQQATKVGSPTPPITPQVVPEQLAESQPQQGQGKGKKGKQKQKQQPEAQQPTPAPLVQQSPPQVPEQLAESQPQQGQGKGKKGKQKQKQQPEAQQPTPAPLEEQPPPQPQSQPADVQASQSLDRDRGKRRGKQQQIEEPPGPPPKVKPATAPELRGRSREQTPTQEPQPGGPWARGQQPGGPWGRGQAPQQQPAVRGEPPQQQPGGPWGRGQAPQQQQQQPVGPWGRGKQAQQPQQQPQQPGGPWGRGQQAQQQPQRPQQQGASPRGAARGQATPAQTAAPVAAKPRVESLQKLQISEQPPRPVKQPPTSFDLAIPRRKNLRSGGIRGLPCTVETNHLALDFNPRYETAIHYDVVITPDKPKRMMRPVWEQFKNQYLRNFPIAFDDVRNAYSPRRMDDIAGEVQVAEDECAKPREYKVVVNYAAEVNLRALFTYMQSGGTTAVPQEALQCIDIVLRNASALRFVRVGRSYFNQPRGGHIISLGDGLELWHGFFQSAVIGWKPFLNVDVAHKGFPKPQRVIDLFAEMVPQRYGDRGDRGDPRGLSLEAQDIDKISKFMKSLKIQYEIRGQPATRKCYRVNSLTQPPGRAMFVHNDVQISVLDYFKNEKRYNIECPQLPCLWVGPRDRKIYLPAELCTILPGQVFNRKLNDIQTAQMVRNAATNSTIRKEKIMSSVRDVNLNRDPVVQAFGLTIGTDFERVKARMLKAPDLDYKDRPVTPSKGVWRADKFLIPQSLAPGSWTIINLDRRTRDDSLSSFVRMLQQNCTQLGMSIGAPEQPFIRMERFDQRQFDDTLRRHKSKSLLFVVVPDFPTNIYGRVKHAAEIKIGCLTQCIKAKTMFKMNPATVGNILLKVNAKLNGQNHTISRNYRPPCLQSPCMIMGADVTHPSPDQTDIPSVAAVTASCDPRAFQYTFSWRLQEPRQEIITDLECIVREQLMFYYKKSHQQPTRIIFFRDGVSEGQFQEVMNMEVQAIRRACSSMGTKDTYKPAITFLVVQKRHHTRFFPTNPRESDDRNFNVRAGTVVDTDITHPTDLEYYLVSHASIQGVARPTKYRVLWDDSNMDEDELEALTYYLCHMFSRCTRSVSYPAPTYYAHLAAFRARVYLEGHTVNLNNLRQEQENMKIKDEIIRGLPMFFV